MFKDGLVEVAAMKAQLHGCRFEEESGDDDFLNFLDDFLW